MTNPDNSPPETQSETDRPSQPESIHSEESIWWFLWNEHFEILVLIIFQVMMAFFIQYKWLDQNILSVSMMDEVFILIYAFFHSGCLVVLMFYTMIKPIPGNSLLASFWIRLRQYFLNQKTIGCLVIMFLLFRVMGSMFTGIKYSIPFVQPFSWDPTFDEIDRVLHFGTRPWEWLQMITTPFISFLLGVLYQSWFFVVIGFFFWMTMSNRYKLRKQFFITYAMSWIVLGGFCAIMFSSAGPCYWGKLYPELDNPYAGLMQYINDIHNKPYEMYVLNVQEWLWVNYEEKHLSVTSGISAFPSLHVAMVVLAALTAWQVHRGFGIGMSVYGFLILVESVHSGWHYAVDGYFSFFMVLGLWKLSGIWINYWGRYEEKEIPKEAES
jgi:hypothetical protein